ncbi:hypothetical protein VTO73DRAFT_10637 [Trametes versicolor]
MMSRTRTSRARIIDLHISGDICQQRRLLCYRKLEIDVRFRAEMSKLEDITKEIVGGMNTRGVVPIDGRVNASHVEIFVWSTASAQPAVNRLTPIAPRRTKVLAVIEQQPHSTSRLQGVHDHPQVLGQQVGEVDIAKLVHYLMYGRGSELLGDGDVNYA